MIWAQSEPAGQQMEATTDELVFSDRHFDPVGQQKLKGYGSPQGERLERPPHSEVSRRARVSPGSRGSNSSFIKITRANDGRRKKERASAEIAKRIVEDIKKCRCVGPAVGRRVQRC